MPHVPEAEKCVMGSVTGSLSARWPGCSASAGSASATSDGLTSSEACSTWPVRLHACDSSVLQEARRAGASMRLSCRCLACGPKRAAVGSGGHVQVCHRG
jgi:hypothetical protein